MSKTKYLVFGFLIGALIGVPALLSGFRNAVEPEQVEAQEIKLTHAQEVWLSALEWCESRGRTEAVNPEDLDGTPSYYSWQFKPGTFRFYGDLYGVLSGKHTDAEIMEHLKEYELQKEIVKNMINDPDVNWLQQFPDCIKRKVGMPPRY